MISSNTEANIKSDKVDVSPTAKRGDDDTDASESAQIEGSENQGVRYGKCKWFNVAKGWGFITPNDGGQEVFVHQSVIQMNGFRSLGEQEDVEFECELTERGLEATRVSGRQGTDCHGSTFRPRTKKRQRRVRCYNCGEFANHIASKCHLGPLPKRCHLCKQDNHLFANCPTKQSTSQSIQHASKDDSSSSSKSTIKAQKEATNEDR